MAFLLLSFVDIWRSKMRPVHCLKTVFNKYPVTGTLSHKTEVIRFIYTC